jgi:hypothetical protein
MINITFSKFVKMNGRLWEVNFRKLNRGPQVFYADTATIQGDRIQFVLQKENSHWDISGSNLPEWLVNSVQSLGASIDLGLQENYPHIGYMDNEFKERGQELRTTAN